MKKPILIWSGINGAGNDTLYEDVGQCIEVWEGRRKLLESKGIELKLLVPRRSIRMSGDLPELPVIEHFAEKSPDMLVSLPGSRRNHLAEIYDQQLNWPRDSFLDLKSQIFSSDSDTGDINLMMTNLNVGKPLTYSTIGEGGLSIGFDHTLILSARERYPVRELDKEMLKNMGYRVFVMPVMDNLAIKPSHDDSHLLFRRMNGNGHLDTELNILEKNSRERTLMVNLEYYNVFQSEVEVLASQIGADIHVITKSMDIMGKALNYITLPDGSIIASEKNEETVRYLVDRLGKDRVHPIELFRREDNLDNGGGGLRCRTNLLY